MAVNDDDADLSGLPRPSRDLAGLGVLVVDDEEAAVYLLRRWLEAAGYANVTGATGGSAAIEYLKANPGETDLVVLDIDMPPPDGFDVLGWLTRADTRDRPLVLAVTAGADPAARRRSLAAGASDFVTKSSDPLELMLRVRNLIEARGLRRKLSRSDIDELSKSESLARAVLATAVDGVITIEETGIITSFNAAATRIFGYEPEEVIGRNTRILMAERDEANHDKYIKNYLRRGEAHIIGIGREVLGRRKDGTVFPLDLAVSEVVLDDGHRVFTGLVRDLTEQAAALEATAAAHRQLEATAAELWAVARHDPLTQLGNRLKLSEDLQQLAERSKRYEHKFCLALFDIDHFKGYNDHYGHAAGDTLLRTVSEVFVAQSRASDYLYRYGGDEFLCAFTEQDIHGALAGVERMSRGVRELAIPNAANTGHGIVTVSSGAAVMGPSAEVEVAMAAADSALYRAKQRGRNSVEFQPESA